MLSHSRENNIEMLLPESKVNRKHCLVLKEDFPQLELRKEIAAVEWLKAQKLQYEHKQSMPEKKAEWEM